MHRRDGIAEALLQWQARGSSEELSGGLRADDRSVDPWSHFVNAFVLDRDGNRINRRNAEDIFVSLYDHQIPPGAADVVHSAFEVPEDVADSVTVEVALRYRKFDTTFMRYVKGPDYPSETFRVLKEKEIRQHGEYRTRRLVLEAWDRMEANGEFTAMGM